jgi:hypothetical protein
VIASGTPDAACSFKPAQEIENSDTGDTEMRSEIGNRQHPGHAMFSS